MGAALVAWALEVPIKATTPGVEQRGRLLLIAMAFDAHDGHGRPWAVADRERWAEVLGTTRAGDVSRLTRVLVDNGLIRKSETYSDGHRAANNRGRWMLRGPFGW